MSSFITTPRAVLFLDVDGVLTTERCLLEEYEEDDESLYFAHKLCPDVKSFIPPLEKSRIAILKVSYFIDEVIPLVFCFVMRSNDFLLYRGLLIEFLI